MQTQDSQPEPGQWPRSDFGNFLVLARHREQQFWQSPAHQELSRSCDWWASAALLFTDCMYFRFQLELQEVQLVPRLLHAALQMLTSVFQLACIKYYAASYSKLRTRLLWIHRFLRCLVIAGMSLVTRTIILSGQSGAHTSSGTYVPGSLPPAQSTGDAIKVAVMSSGALLAFVSTVMPLPLPQHVLGQLLQLALLVTLQLPASRVMVQATVAEGHMQELCRRMNSGIDLLSLAYLGATPGTSSLNRHCDTHSADIVVFFVDLLLALVLPTYVAYRTEKQQKVAFLRALQRQEREGHEDRVDKLLQGSYVVAVLGDLFLLTLAALQSWVLALVGYKYLHLLTVPVNV